MNLRNGYQQYREQSVLTASPGDLLLMLYDGCIRQLKLAKLSLAEKQMEDAGTALLKAQDIIDELIQGLDFQYDVANHLFRVYEYINHELIQANITKDGQQIDALTDILSELRSTWEQVIKINRQAEHAAV